MYMYINIYEGSIGIYKAYIRFRIQDCWGCPKNWGKLKGYAGAFRVQGFPK